ncbi:hypothetical protein I4U23_000547 [Adineta vaga]|nr:hypothetical protein I4U23_000547 [Adineta vaga]
MSSLKNFFFKSRRNKELSSSDINEPFPSMTDINSIRDGLVIWLDNEDIQLILTESQRIPHPVDIFKDDQQCFEFLRKYPDERAFVIISGQYDEETLHRVHDCDQVDSIYFYYKDKRITGEKRNDWSKVKNESSDMVSINKMVDQDIKKSVHNAPPRIYFELNNKTSDVSLDTMNYSFMYSLILKKIVLKLTYNNSDIKEFIDYCRKRFEGDIETKEKIAEFQKKYKKKDAIKWYTEECFLYKELNRALRQVDIGMIMKMSFFIQHLHQQLDLLRIEQYKKRRFRDSFRVYRGQQLSKSILDQLRSMKSEYFSFNSFLSTSQNLATPLEFFKLYPATQNLINILFIMDINPAIASNTFAAISGMSVHGYEEEILFSMHTVFRIKKMKLVTEDKNDCYWQIELEQVDDFDHELNKLTTFYHRETEGLSSWDHLGRFLIDVGQFDKAEKIYKTILQKESNQRNIANVYNQLAVIEEKQSRYDAAITYATKSLEILKTIDSVDASDFASCYTTLGIIYTRIGDRSNAFSCLKEALRFREDISHSDEIDLADSYNNLGLLCKEMKDYPKALSYLEKAFKLRQKNLPCNHPKLVQAHNNLVSIYSQMNLQSEGNRSSILEKEEDL